MTENKKMYVRCYFGGIVLTVGNVKNNLKHHLKEIFASGMCKVTLLANSFNVLNHPFTCSGNCCMIVIRAPLEKRNIT